MSPSLRLAVAEAAETGVDIFRIFDALNDVSQMAPAIRAVRETGTAVAEVARDRAVAAATAAVEIRFICSLILLVEDPKQSMWALCPT